MAVTPNSNRRTNNPGRYFGPAMGLNVLFRGRGDRFNVFVSESYAKTASVPDGYGASVHIPPLTAGGMGGSVALSLVSSGDLLQGGPMEGAATVTISESVPDLSLTISMSGSAAVELTTEGNLAGVIGMDGTATVTFSADGANMGSIIPIEGSALFGLTGTADLKGLMSMSGESTSFTELSPQSLAAAVLAASVEGSIDTGGALRVILAAVAGKATGGGTGTITFRDTTDARDRLVLSVDVDGNRSSVTLDPT